MSDFGCKDNSPNLFWLFGIISFCFTERGNIYRNREIFARVRTNSFLVPGSYIVEWVLVEFFVDICSIRHNSDERTGQNCSVFIFISFLPRILWTWLIFPLSNHSIFQAIISFTFILNYSNLVLENSEHLENKLRWS